MAQNQRNNMFRCRLPLVMTQSNWFLKLSIYFHVRHADFIQFCHYQFQSNYNIHNYKPYDCDNFATHAWKAWNINIDTWSSYMSSLGNPHTQCFDSWALFWSTNKVDSCIHIDYIHYPSESRRIIPQYDLPNSSVLIMTLWWFPTE